MTVAQIQALALSNTHTNSGQVSASNLILWFNLARQKVGNTLISQVSEKFFYQIWTRDAIADQINGEYPYPEAYSDSAGMLKAEKVYIKGYSDDTYFKVCREVDPSALSEDWLWYLANQSKSDPIYFIADESIFIAPQFDSDDLPTSPSGNAQIKLAGIAKLTDLTVSGTEAQVLIPVDFHELVALGMEQYIYKNRGKMKESISSRNEFTVGLREMVDDISNRDISQMNATTPNDETLQYGS